MVANMYTPFIKLWLYLWQLPQNLLGLAYLLLFSNSQKRFYDRFHYYYDYSMRGSVTLGEYIFTGSKASSTLRHEYGHVIQSRILGPLYLIIIGLPSILHAAIKNEHCCDHYSEGYYHFFTEKWAQKLSKKYLS